MIRINLLPIEKRKQERTPLPRFMLIVTTAGVTVGIIFLILLVWMNILTIGRDIAARRKELDNLAKDIQRYDLAAQEQKLLSAKLGELKQVLYRKAEFWRAVNAIWEVVHEHPKIWIDDLRVIDEKAAASQMKKTDKTLKDMPEYGVLMKAHVSGSEVVEMSRFRTALKTHPVVAKVLPNLNYDTEWKVDDEPDFEEKTSMSFEIRLLAKIPEPKAPAKPVKAAAKKKA